MVRIDHGGGGSRNKITQSGTSSMFEQYCGYHECESIYEAKTHSEKPLHIDTTMITVNHV